MGFEEVFHEIALLLVLAAVAGAVAVRLRQPPIIAFIAVGMLAGPSALEIASSGEVDLLAELGIALLLFAVGLRLDLRLIRSTGRVAVVAGVGQMALTAGIGLPLGLLLGLDLTTAVYVALGLAFSSTIIVVKLLSDLREIDELRGRVAVGILIVQDIAVVIAMIALTAIGAGDESVPQEVALVALKGVALVGGIALVTRYALTPALHRLAHLPELLVLAAIAWGVGLSAIGDVLGFSGEVGAFLGGVALASTPYREAISARLTPLRDFLLLFFFVDLGSDLDLGEMRGEFLAAAVLSGFVLLAKPLVVVTIMSRMGYSPRVGFLTGVSLGQISEFSLILGALGVSLGHIDEGGLALIAAIALLTIFASTYATMYSHRLLTAVERWLLKLEREPGAHPAPPEEEGGPPTDVIVFGLGRYGRRLADELAAGGQRVLGVDFDPRAVASWRETGHPAMYGDLEDPELATSLPLAEAKWVVSTVPRPDASHALLHTLRHHDFGGRVAVTAHYDEHVDHLGAGGADLVLHPFETAARDAALEIAGRKAVAQGP